MKSATMPVRDIEQGMIVHIGGELFEVLGNRVDRRFTEPRHNVTVGPVHVPAPVAANNRTHGKTYKRVGRYYQVKRQTASVCWQDCQSLEVVGKVWK